ncbi:MAG: contractile injection system tape measure protein [Odoribacter sp.]
MNCFWKIRLSVNLPVEEVLPSRDRMEGWRGRIDRSLTENLRLSWPKMKNTSLEGLRHSFLQREGMLEQEGEWKLTVHPKGLDVLLDSLPWGFSMVRLPWMDKNTEGGMEINDADRGSHVGCLAALYAEKELIGICQKV